MRSFLWLLALFFALLLISPVLQAKVVGTARGHEITVRLFDDQGDCPDGTFRALWEQVHPGLLLEGCYVRMDGRVYIFWANGDRDIVKETLFQPGI